MSVRTRSGTLLLEIDLNDCWSSLTNAANSFDTRVQFDPHSHRFILMSAGALGDTANSALLLAVTETEDPTGNWFRFRIPVDPNGVGWLDHPTLGFNQQWLVVSGNVVDMGTAP